MPNEELKNLPSTDFYDDFWELANKAGHSTKFIEEEKNISQQLLNQLKKENNPVQQQYIVLSLILFGKLIEVQDFIIQKFWSQQFREKYKHFAVSEHFVNTVLTHKDRVRLGNIADNESLAASLYERYFELINKYSQAVINEETCPPVQDYQIYFCWLQGEENLPPICRCCYNSLKQNAGQYKIVFIDEKNFSNYVDIAPHIMDKFKAEKISRTHFSDILRVNLLERYGGLWLDASFLVTEPLENHRDLLEMVYFTQSFCKEKSYTARFAGHITYGRWMVGILGTTLKHSPLYSFLKDFFDNYLKEFDFFIHKFLLDFAISLAYDNIPSIKKDFDNIPINNLDVWEIHAHLNDFYEDYPFDKILKNTFLYNISYKIGINKTKPKTVFREIQRRYDPDGLLK